MGENVRKTLFLYMMEHASVLFASPYICYFVNRRWEVTYDDGDKQDYEFMDLFRIRANRPTRPFHPCGRQLYALELFSGCGKVTQEFVDLKWRCRSLDSSTDQNVNATDTVDLMNIKFHDIGFVPDFIWASPPCSTYSFMTGGQHRRPKNGKYEISKEAHEHNRLFVQMVTILKFFKRLNPHLIVMIENPLGHLAQMPLMHELEESFPLYKVEVHYCTLGRAIRKPTNLWTNVSVTVLFFLSL